MKRINIVGTSGSGKSTFGRQMAEILNYPYHEMDTLFWKADWQESDDQEFMDKVRQATASSSWILDGNYNRTVPVKWAHADTVIWIDHSFARTLYQAVKRAFIRCLTKQELWPGTGNKETFRKSFFSKDSVVLWTIKTHGSNRKRYEGMMDSDKYQHIRFIRLSGHKQIKQFLAELAHTAE